MKRKNILIIISFLILLFPVIVYIINFRNSTISKDTEIWGNFGDYVNGTFMPIIALLGVLVTYYLGIISEKRNNANIEIEQLKHRPILHIGYFDSEDFMEIFIENKGNGPLIIKKYLIINEIDNSEIDRIYDCLPSLINDDYNNYTGNIIEIVLKPNEKFQLFLYESEANDKNSIENRRAIRESISKYKISIEYQDVYENIMPKSERSLIWFGRNL